MSDPILYWNAVALEANRVSHTDKTKSEQTGPTASARALAIVHLAMYDAYAGAKGNPNSPVNLGAFLPGLPNATNADANAAVAAAAHATLSGLYPAQKSFFDLKHAEAGLKGEGLRAGHKFGLKVAAKILSLRKNDPSGSDNGYAVSQAPGAHRQDPDSPDQPINAPFYGANSKTFATTKRHALNAPPKLGTEDYLFALKQVREKGIAPQLMGTLPACSDPRTPAETIIGLYWGYDGAAGLGTPPRLYNQIIRTIAISRNNTVDENARLFALVNVAMGDAGILGWQQKYFHDVWRPVLGIREGDASLGPAAVGGDATSPDFDAGWLPLGAPATNSTGAKNFTPPFPAYPSGHATFGAAALHATRLFYNVNGYGSDDLFEGLEFVSDELNGVNKDNTGAVRPRHARAFPGGLWQMIEENGLSRVFLGVHWHFDAFLLGDTKQPDIEKSLAENVGGTALGIRIAEDIFSGSFKYTGV